MSGVDILWFGGFGSVVSPTTMLRRMRIGVAVYCETARERAKHENLLLWATAGRYGVDRVDGVDGVEHGEDNIVTSPLLFSTSPPLQLLSSTRDVSGVTRPPPPPGLAEISENLAAGAQRTKSILRPGGSGQPLFSLRFHSARARGRQGEEGRRGRQARKAEHECL